MIGFGRFGQVVSQCLLAEKAEVSIIDNDVEMIQAAGNFGFRIYYGDGTRLDVLHAAGAGKARLICVCVDKREAADKIVELVKAEFPLAKLFVRSFDRGHTIHLRSEGVDYEIRELFESALVYGQEALAILGVDRDAAAEIAADLRKRDAARLEMQIHEGIQAGMHLMHQQKPTPTPLTEPKRRSKPLNPEAETCSATRRGSRDDDAELGPGAWSLHAGLDHAPRHRHDADRIGRPHGGVLRRPLNLFYIAQLGEQELAAAIGYAGTVLFFLTSFGIGLSIAGTALVSRALGAGDRHKARRLAPPA